MKLSMIQFDIAWEDPHKNIAKIEELSSQIQNFNTDVLILPEMWPCGFSMTPSAHQFGVPAVEYMMDLAKRLGCHVIGGVPQKVNDAQENQAVWVEPNGHVRARYAKIKLFTHAREHRFFQGGHRHVVWQVSDFRVSPFICYDLRFPELARKTMPRAQVLIYLASWPAPRIAHWRQLLQARAIENQCYAIGVNRTGRDGNEWEYCGSSIVVDPMGQIVLDAADQEDVFSTDLSADLVATTRNNFPFLADMD